MSTSIPSPSVLMIGVGGLGSAAALVLAKSQSLRLTLIDDDVVDPSNLHRQLLYTEADVGESKLETASSALLNAADEAGHALRLELVHGRFTPSNAMVLAENHDLVIEGADNLPTKFLAADACHLANTPLVQAGAIRWQGWAMASDQRSVCLRCVFEDIPTDRVETCAEAGVIGPVVGAMGALQASLEIRLLNSIDDDAAGELWHYDALPGKLRKTHPQKRSGCALCEGQIHNLNPERYQSACAA